ncbi:MAG: DUF1579 family protein [Acidobacteriota bacterium]
MSASRISAIVYLWALAACVGAAQAPAPAPGPEYKVLESLVGVWHFDGRVNAIPELGMTDSGPVTYTHVNQMAHGGFFLETRRTGTGPRGPVTELFVYSYTPATKTYRQDTYDNRGRMRTFTATVVDRTWQFTGTNTSATGQTTTERYTMVYAADMMSAALRSEHSKDNVTWFERMTGTYVRMSR